MSDVNLPLLDRVQIASPCTARWEDMTGDDRTRHCAQCNLKVHNIAAMTRVEAEAFLQESFAAGGRVCGRLYRRSDGTVLTADCPVGLAAVRAKARATVVRIAAALGVTTLVGWAAARESGSVLFARIQPLSAIAHYLKGDPVPPPMPAGGLSMGSIAPSPRSTAAFTGGAQ